MVDYNVPLLSIEYESVFSFLKEKSIASSIRLITGTFKRNIN